MSLDRFQQLRLLEAVLFATAEPLSERSIAARMPDGADVKGLVEELQGIYANRGVTLRQIGEGWAFRTADDLAPYFRLEKHVPRKLSRAAIETLAIIAYHQPVTRAEIEEIRGVAVSKGTMDILLEAGWIRPRGRKPVPGRPVRWGTTDAFLDQFGLDAVHSLPGLQELKAAGLLDARGSAATLAMRPSESGLADSEALEAETEDEFEQDYRNGAGFGGDEDDGAEQRIVNGEDDAIEPDDAGDDAGQAHGNDRCRGV